jgi:hypothetical protein
MIQATLSHVHFGEVAYWGKAASARILLRNSRQSPVAIQYL